MDPTKLNDQKLQEFLQRWPELSLATDQDNDEILSLTREVSMESGANKICFDDAPNFLTYPMSLGSDCLYFIWRNPSHDNKKGELVGTATIIFKDKIFDGAKKRVAYLAGLRFSTRMSRKLRARWRSVYRDILKLLLGKGSCYSVDYAYTSVLDENNRAKNCFLKSRYFKYIPKEKYRSINTAAFMPWGLFGISFLQGTKLFGHDYDIEKLNANVDEQYTDFLNRQLTEKMVMPSSTYKSEKPNLFAVYKAGKIVCSCEIDHKDSRKYFFKAISLKIMALNIFLKILKRPVVKPEENLRILNINFFIIDRELPFIDKILCVMQLLAQIYKNEKFKDFHIVNFIPPCGMDRAEIDKLSLWLKMFGVVFHSEHGTLYEVQPEGMTGDRKNQLGKAPMFLEVGYL